MRRGEVMSLSLSIQRSLTVLDNINANHRVCTVSTMTVILQQFIQEQCFSSSSQISDGAHLRGDQVRGSEGVKGHIQGQLIT